MEKIISFILTCAAGFLVVDFLGACMWIVSGQVPPEGYFVGSLTQYAGSYVVALF